jgi:hypothetical protein
MEPRRQNPRTYRPDVDRAVDGVYLEYGKKQEPRYWEVFLHGTDEQRKAVQEELARVLDERDPTENDQ